MTVRRGIRFCVALIFCSLLATSGAVGLAMQDGQITVTDVSLDRTTVETGETVTVEGIVENEGSETQPVDVTLTVDGSVAETRTAEAVQPGFPVIATFDWTPSEPGTYQLAINGVEAESELVVEDSSESGDEESDSDQGTDSEEGTDEDGDDGPGPSQFEVRNVTLDEADIAPGETTTVVADIGNNGDERGDYEVTLEIDGEPVRTETVTEVQPLLEVGAQQRFDYTPAEAGTYTISVNGIEANQQLVVEESGGGGLFGFLGVLPLGLIRTVVLFVGLPILLIYLALKGLAIYLGY